MQYFNGDDVEKKYYNSGAVKMNELSLQKDEFFDDAYACQVFGDLLFEEMRSPLSNAMPKEIFRESFSEIVQSFIEVGTFESYLTVFRKIFGPDVDVTFTVPAAGKLNILIVAEGLEISNFVSRYIQSNQYNFDNVITQDGDQIVFQTVNGFQSQYELEQMLFEMVPSGIFTSITLTI